MKKQILTLTILSSALNINYAHANELVRATPDCKINVLGVSSFLSLSCLQITELSDKELRGQIEKAVSDLITASQIKPSDKEDEKKGKELEKTLLKLKDQVSLIDKNHPEISYKVKSKILGELLRTGIVEINKEELERSANVELDLSDSIVRELERRGNIRDVVSRGGTICF
ncbi:MAG: hypothetical protein COV91_03520 [Candidatus Taylorbacteria bacterium CG11_big_fil_rev_8_21_14_0_20_46_11]|uniref:Uncharacterized protein n=1 Tax=Candidatus Taylorbacteria bacterium CG11_big_fil_rev_8_21_14_0_20_46_11 TaxID=1975025 RepID=A0A2H0KBD8_9BACT|nr:MAG: hypothetical protein COV91_03520 [Candidatus Taylorbacteria bacterium CG11_big_fil_rev_8_21_14_0_20_46_11]